MNIIIIPPVIMNLINNAYPKTFIIAIIIF